MTDTNKKPEFERFNCETRHDYNDTSYGYMEPNKDGEYVSYEALLASEERVKENYRLFMLAKDQRNVAEDKVKALSTYKYFIDAERDKLLSENQQLKDWRSKDQSCIEKKDHEIFRLNQKLEAAEKLLTDIEPSVLPECHRVRRQHLLKASK